MKKKILVIGSGEAEPVDASGFDIVYASNSAFSRANRARCIHLVLSDAMLFSSDMLEGRSPIAGMDESASTSFRLKKYSTIDNKFFECVTVVDNKSVAIESAIARKNVSCNALAQLTHSELWRVFYKCFGIRDLMLIFISLIGLKNKLRFLAQMTIKTRMNVSFRPSTGTIALMLAYCNYPEAEIYISGMNVYDDTGVRPGVYSTGRMIHDSKIHLMDNVYGALLHTKGVRALTVEAGC